MKHCDKLARPWKCQNAKVPNNCIEFPSMLNFCEILIQFGMQQHNCIAQTQTNSHQFFVQCFGHILLDLDHINAMEDDKKGRKGEYWKIHWKTAESGLQGCPAAALECQTCCNGGLVPTGGATNGATLRLEILRIGLCDVRQLQSTSHALSCSLGGVKNDKTTTDQGFALKELFRTREERIWGLAIVACLLLLHSSTNKRQERTKDNFHDCSYGHFARLVRLARCSARG